MPGLSARIIPHVMKRIAVVACALSFVGCGGLDPEMQAQLEGELGQSDSALFGSWNNCPPLFNDEAPNTRMCARPQVFSATKINYSGDVDWHRYRVRQGARVALVTSGFWAEFRLEDSNRTELATWSGRGVHEIHLSDGNDVYVRVARRPQWAQFQVPTFGYVMGLSIINEGSGGERSTSGSGPTSDGTLR